MNPHVIASRRALGAGLGLGVLGTVLLRDGGAPGVDAAIWLLALVGATIALHRRSGRHMSAEAFTWLGVAVMAGLGLVWRDSPALKLLALCCAGTALALPALHAGAAWMRNGSIGEYIHAFVSAALTGARGAPLALRDAQLGTTPPGRAPSPLRHAGAVVRGAALAALPLLVFTSLLSAADVVFAGMLDSLVRFDAERLQADVMLTAVLAWAAGGYLYGFTAVARRAGRVSLPTPVVVGVTEVCVALGMLNLLFLAFVAVQFRYLFGGVGLIEVTPGLTYAEYARRGFFELVFAVALVLPLLLVADAVLRRREAAHDALFRAFAGLQILLVLGMAVSALERMRLYRAAYGLTEQRVYATALLILLAVVLVWFAATVLRRRRRHFAFGAILACYATVGTLFVLNPDALIAHTNVQRATAAEAAASLDIRHMASLSADAVPVLLRTLPALPDEARCELAARLLERWPAEREFSLRDWNLAEARAVRAVSTNGPALYRMTSDPAACGQLSARAAGVDAS